MGDIRQRLTEAINERINGWSGSRQLCGNRRPFYIVLVRDVVTNETNFGSLHVRVCGGQETDADARDQLIRDWIGLWSRYTLELDEETEVRFNSSMLVDCWTPDDHRTRLPHELCEARRLRYRYRWESIGCCTGDGMDTDITFNVDPPSV